MYGAPVVLEVKAAVGKGPVDSIWEKNVVTDVFVAFSCQPPRDTIQLTETRIAHGTPHIYGDTCAGAEVFDVTLVVAATDTES